MAEVSVTIRVPDGFEPDMAALADAPARCLTALGVIQSYDPNEEDIYLSEIRAILQGNRPVAVAAAWSEAMEVVDAAAVEG